MFSGLVRWFHQHVQPFVSSTTTTLFTPLLHDVESAGGQLLSAAVKTAAAQAVALASGGQVDLGKVLQSGLDAGKEFLVKNGLPDLEHAAAGVAAAVTAEVAAAQAPTVNIGTVNAVNPAILVPPAS